MRRVRFGRANVEYHIEAGRDSEGGELHGKEEGLLGELERCERKRDKRGESFFL